MRQKEKVEIATVYNPEGTVDVYEPANGKKFKFKELQKFVGGLVECVQVEERGAMGYVNEEGALKNLPANPFTKDVLRMKVYALNGYPKSWRVRGPIVVVRAVKINA